MKQIVQNFKSGETELEELPAPKIKPGNVLIKTHSSLVSLGTERMLVEFGKANLINKARQQPEKVKQVLDKMKTDGLVPTVEAVFRKLDSPMPLGYCNAGEIIEVGDGVNEFQLGDRVVSNGPHAEVVCVPKNLVAKIPSGVSYDEAAFTVVGAIGLQGIRLANPTFGETVVVIGLGLVGLLTAELLKANGCNVIGLDFDEQKLKLAKEKGIKAFNSSVDDPVSLAHEVTSGVGADVVIITASTKSNEVIKQSARMSRKRGRIILVGVIGLDINRSDFYEKELSFQVSCSYGPGRYDDFYEQMGNDYPIPYVRWTEKRNFEAVLSALDRKQLDVKPLITQVVNLSDYNKIYDNMNSRNQIASIIQYSDNINTGTTIKVSDNKYSAGRKSLGIIGAGNFTQSVILPSLKEAGAAISYIASSKGLSGTKLAQKYGITHSTSDYQSILSDDSVGGIIVTTRHNLHARICIEALKAGKDVFVEKPLALDEQELESIISTVDETGKNVTVGFNRRFSPHAQKIKELIGDGSVPISVIATMNAGFIEQDSWVQDLKVGGGRIIGEACHLVDLITYFTGSKISEVCMNAMGKDPKENADTVSILLKYNNGALAVINYFANGSKSYDKERVEVYSQGKTLVLENFRITRGFGYKNFSKLKTKQDKGHNNQFSMLAERMRDGGNPLIPFSEIVNTTRATFAAVESMKKGTWIEVPQ